MGHRWFLQCLESGQDVFVSSAVIFTLENSPGNAIYVLHLRS